MTRIYKSVEGERVVRERYLEILKRCPVPNRQLRVATREGETFVVACGAEDAPPLVLSLTKASIVGVLLGGWLALDYATRRTERVGSVMALCPAGDGRR